jgi:hypothetical protein
MATDTVSGLAYAKQAEKPDRLFLHCQLWRSRQAGARGECSDLGEPRL